MNKKKVSKCTDCCYAHVQNVSSLVDSNDVSLRTNSATYSIKTIWMFCTLFQNKKFVPQKLNQISYDVSLETKCTRNDKWDHLDLARDFL